jgi:Bacterial extracellular solute-binding protein/TAT (twin-arginine translocation) pathway signal sequence
MTNQSGTKVTRRDFLKTTTVGTLAAGLGPFFLFPERAQAQQKTLKIIQWGHFVPAYDRWFDGVFTKHKHGRALPPAHRSTYNPKTKKYFAFSDSFLPNPSNWRKDLWEQAGYPNGPDTYDELRDGAKKIRDNLGNPCGMGLSRESDTNASLRAILWSFGGAEQDEHGNVTINSKQTVEAMKYMRALYKESETAEVFSWDPTSNNRAMLSGKISYTMNAISITRAAEKENPDMSNKIWISSALKGPVRRIAPRNVDEPLRHLGVCREQGRRQAISGGPDGQLWGGL